MTSAAKAGRDGDPLDSAFEIQFRGRRVEVAVRAPQDGGDAATVDEVMAALESAPLDTVTKARVEAAVRKANGGAVSVGEVEAPPGLLRPWFIQVSPDGLAAYVVPVSPVEGAVPPAEKKKGTAQPSADSHAAMEEDEWAEAEAEVEDDEAPEELVSAALLGEMLAEAGVTTGIQGDVLQSFESPRALTEICCLARGRAATPGRDAEIDFAFDTESSRATVRRDDGRIDYHGAMTELYVEAGEVLAKRRPPVEGEPGMDVRGRAVPPPSVRERALEQIVGRGAEVRADDTLVAVEAGRPVSKAGHVEVVPVYEVERDLNYSVGSIEFSGDVVVRGDVKPDFWIRAGGSVVVHGITESASITAGEDVTLAGVVGHGDCVIEAGGNLVAHYLNDVKATAGGDVLVTREIVNCEITANRVEPPPRVALWAAR